MRLNGTSAFAPIKLSDNNPVPRELQVLRVGSFNHPRYGLFDITSQVLAEMKANFDNKVRGIDMAFDYFHESDKEASAWVNSLSLREDGTELWADVTWTPKAEQKLSERELRYFSPDFAFSWTDPETNQTFENVLFGGGLTNRPFVKEMMAIVADETKGENMTELEKANAKVKELEAKNIKLSDDLQASDAKLKAVPPPAANPPPPAAADPGMDDLKKQLAQLQEENKKLKGDNEVMMAEKAKASEAAKLAEKKSEFTLMLSEGKVCKAQEEAFIKGDMKEFVKLAQPLNLRASGHTGDGEPTLTLDDKTKAIIKLAEEKEKANPKLTRGESISLAKKELQ